MVSIPTQPTTTTTAITPEPEFEAETGHNIQLLYSWFNHFNRTPAPVSDMTLQSLEKITRMAVKYREDLGRLQIDLDYTTQGESWWQHTKRSLRTFLTS